MVWSREDRSGRMSFQSVLRQYSNPYPDTVYITLRDLGTGSEQTIISNRIHPYFVQRLDTSPPLHLTAGPVPSNSEGHVYQGDIPGGAWIDADHLRTGDRLLQSDEEWSEVVSVRVVPEPLKAYNLTVAHSETFCVRAGDADEGADAVWVHTCLDDLARLHNQPGLPAAGAAGDTYTLAQIEVNGQKILGQNGKFNSMPGVNAITQTHAELDALYQIQKQGLDVSGKTLTLFVDRVPCASCDLYGGIRSMVEQLGLKSLNVVSPAGRIQIVPR